VEGQSEAGLFWMGGIGIDSSNEYFIPSDPNLFVMVIFLTFIHPHTPTHTTPTPTHAHLPTCIPPIQKVAFAAKAIKMLQISSQEHQSAETTPTAGATSSPP